MKTFITGVFLLLCFIFVPFIWAEEARQESRGYTCLDFDHCSGWADDGKNKKCEPIDNDAVHTSLVWSHRSQIDLDNLEGLPLNSQVLVTECIDAGIDLSDPPDGKSDPVCTTGDSAQDKFLFCGNANHPNPICDHYTLLKEHKDSKGNKDIQYSLDRGPSYGIYYLKNGVYQKSIGEIIPVGSDGRPIIEKIEWESYTKANLFRKFIGWYFIPGSVSPTQIPLTGQPSIPPEGGGQKQGILTFPTYIPSPSSPSVNIEDCKGRQYDPYGRVFDIKTLEPIPLADVLLKQKNPQGVFDSEYAKQRNFIVNPFSTGDDGEYLFFVEDGDYKLEPKMTGYSHPATSEQSSLLSNTSFIYSDLYFSNSPAILQRGAIQHRDIPLMPTNASGNSYPLKILTEGMITNANGMVEYSGKVSHPFAELVIETCKNVNGAEVCNNPKIYDRTSGGPNKYGSFSITLDQKLLQTGEYYSRSFRKIDLTTAKLSYDINFKSFYSWIISLLAPHQVIAQDTAAVTSKASLQPIISYLEGFAYDAKGNLLPGAQVNILVPLSEVPVYQTFADQKGYYKITSEFLPNTEYEVKYIQPNAPTTPSTKITTSQLLAQNEEFIAAEKINPYLTTTQSTDPRKNITPSYVPKATISVTQSENQNQIQPTVTENTQTDKQNTISNSSLLLIGSILLLLIAAVGTLIGIYLYRKKSQESSEI